MTLRKKVLGGLAALIVTVALIVAMVNITTKPTFSTPASVSTKYTTLPVTCHAIGPGQLDGSRERVSTSRGDGSVDLDDSEEVYEGMSQEDFETYLSRYDQWESIPPGVNERQAYRDMIQERITFYCGQLRENQQTGLIMTFGVSLLLLLSVGIAAILTEPRRTKCCGDPSKPVTDGGAS